MHRHVLRTILSLLGCVLFVQTAHSAVELDRIIAVINDDVVMKSELDEKIRTVKNQLKEQGTTLPPVGSCKNRYWID